jgi:hypothetical protein
MRADSDPPTVVVVMVVVVVVVMDATAPATEVARVERSAGVMGCMARR